MSFWRLNHEAEFWNCFCSPFPSCEGIVLQDFATVSVLHFHHVRESWSKTQRSTKFYMIAKQGQKQVPTEKTSKTVRWSLLQFPFFSIHEKREITLISKAYEQPYDFSQEIYVFQRLGFGVIRLRRSALERPAECWFWKKKKKFSWKALSRYCKNVQLVVLYLAFDNYKLFHDSVRQLPILFP